MIGLVNYAKDPHSVELREVPIPKIGEEDVLFSVEAAGICGSSLPLRRDSAASSSCSRSLFKAWESRDAKAGAQVYPKHCRDWP